MAARADRMILGCFLAIAPAAVGQEPDTVTAVIEAYQRSFSEWVARVSAEPDPQRRVELIEERPDKTAVARRLLSMTQASEAGDARLTALVWVYAEGEEDALRTRALEALLRERAFGSRLARVTPMLERDGHERARTALENMVAQGDGAAAAKVALASWLLQFGEPNDRPRAVAMLDDVARSGDASPHPEGGTLSETARARLLEQHRLQIGCTAPDIGGLDLSGRRLRLHDYRGRAVLLTFWAHWCGGCMTQAVAERELVAAYEGRPFAVVGVNADLDPPERVLAMNREKQVPWRSFRNDAEHGPFGSIARRWNVRTMPTTYLIGHDGEILDRWKGAVATRDELFASVERAVERAEAAASSWRAEDHLPELGVGDPAPPLEVEHWLRGRPVDRFEPGKIYVVDFWATWCGSCIAGFPELEALRRDFERDGVEVLALTNVDDRGCTLDAVRSMVRDPEQHMDFTVGCSDGSTTYRRWVTASGHHGIPTTLIVDQDGRIASTGHRSDREVVEMLLDGSFDMEAERQAYRTGMMAAARLERAGQMLRASDPAAPAFVREIISGPSGSLPWFLCSVAESILIDTPEGTAPDLDLAHAAAERARSRRADRSDTWFDTVLADIEFRRGNATRAADIMDEAADHASDGVAERCRQRADAYRSGRS